MKVTIHNIQAYLDSSYAIIHCNNGFTCSISAGWGCHSQPTSNRATFYRQVEVGYLSSPYRPIKMYADKIKSYPNTTFSYVPVDIVAAMLNANGGIDEEKTANRSNLYG